MADFGGEMTFTYGGAPLVLRAKFDSELVPFEADGGANQDGSVYRTLKPTGYMFEPLFEDTAISTPTNMDWEAIIRGGPYNCTLVETQTGRLYTWTAAQFEGTPRLDHQTGEVSGIKMRRGIDNFKRRAA